ncbi:FAD-dependent oxidoreductase [uncultured Adlercreutzia sp.]|uniref:FAD-dependent oxidoreductase n=1 Tax=uncultured Adlercreutzia sp. TaxID=875803 RepID=UPI0026F3A01D|nr:FAD-dependent oxidoreductase [uncultured Adlercreutzia sp.]
MENHRNNEALVEHLSGLRGRIPLSRRNFLAGAGVLAASAAATGMIAGCSPQTPAESGAGAPSGSGEAMAATGAAAATGNEGKTMGEVLGAGWLGEEPEIAADEIAQTQEADIIVCGAGHAGTAVARRAAELGASVIVVEVQPEDTFSALGNDIGHLNSSWQLDRVGIPEYSVVDFMSEYQMYGAGRVQPTLLSQFANRSGEALDWFIDGYTEDEKNELIPLNWPVVEGYNYKKGPFTSYVGTCQFGGSVGMTDAVKRSQDKARAAGAQFVFGQAATRLVHNEDGTEVTGVIAKDSSTGDYVQYNGRAVVLACGDIGSNSAMYNAICRENYELGEYKDCSAMSGRDGSGIAMAMRIGAKVEIATGGDMGSHAFIPLSPMEGVECLWLNKYGERYCNEAFGGPLLSGCAGAREPGDRAYLVWGGDWKEVFLNQLAGHLAPKEWDDETIASVQATMEAAVGSGAEGDDTSGKFLYCADTLEELCDFMGMEEGVKANTLAAIEKWNAAHDAGVDTEFGRDPETMWPIKDGPFYGYPCSKRVGGGSLVATSGLLVTGRQQVQGQGFEPIKGLFACGNTSGGRFPMGYNGIMNGVSIGMCLCLGYTLGEYLATEDFDRYCTLGAGNADIKQSENGMAGPPMGGGGEGEGGEGGAPAGDGAADGEGGAPAGDGAPDGGAPAGGGAPA